MVENLNYSIVPETPSCKLFLDYLMNQCHVDLQEHDVCFTCFGVIVLLLFVLQSRVCLNEVVVVSFTLNYTEFNCAISET